VPYLPRWRLRLRLQTLRRDLERWPTTIEEYRALALDDPTLPNAQEILLTYGSWRRATEDVLDPRIPEGWDLDAIYADYLAGRTQTELAKRLGVNAETVRVAFLRAGLPKRTMREVNAVNSERAARKARGVADTVRAEVVDAYRRTGVVKETAEATGVGYDLVQRVLREEGFIFARGCRPAKMPQKVGGGRPGSGPGGTVTPGP